MGTRYSFNIEQEQLDKLREIADYEGRSFNGQVAYLIRNCIDAFEKEHGTIELGKKPVPGS